MEKSEKLRSVSPLDKRIGFFKKQCLGKRKMTEKQANRRLQKIYLSKNIRLYNYVCPTCGFYHLTKHKQD